MAINRHRYNRIVNNNRDEYREQFKGRSVPFINHHIHRPFKQLKVKDVPNLSVVEHVWTVGDKYYKLADKYYGDSLYWWVIALFNNKPLESDLELGSLVLVPTPLDLILSAMEI